MKSRMGLVFALLLSLIATPCWGCRAGRIAAPNIGAVFSFNISDGVAISLNSLQGDREKMGGRLPGLKLRGVLFDRKKNDWVLFGDAAPERPGLPADALAIALRAVHTHLDAPGIDIRPRANEEGGHSAVQQIEYTGGVAGSVTGHWFYSFDYWMKRVSLAQEAVPLPDVPVYWQRAITELEREVAECTASTQSQASRHNRWWLCAGGFKATEGDDTLTFEATPLQVLAEGVSPTDKAVADRPSSPCATRGTNDPLAAEYAKWLTEHLDEVSRFVPVVEIEEFSKLLAGFAWLAEMDPYRDLSPWLNKLIVPIETPDTVPTIALQAEREHIVTRGDIRYRHIHQIQMSGGVLVVPTLARTQVTDDSLLRLQHAVLDARPPSNPPNWQFTFSLA